MPPPLLHQPEPPLETGGPGAKTRTYRGRVRPADGSLSAYLFAMVHFDLWGPNLPPGYERETHFAPCGEWCRYEIIDTRSARRKTLKETA